MPPLDEIAQKRAQFREQQASKDSQDTMHAIRGNGADMVASISNVAKASDIAPIVDELRRLQLDQLMTAQQNNASGKATVILTDQTDLGDKMSELADKVAVAIGKLDSSDHDSKEIDSLASLKSSLDTFNKQQKQSATELLRAIKAIQVEPQVTVQEREIDFAPLITALQDDDIVEEDTGIDLECYKAQDLTNDGDMQYVGMMNTQGNWYIIENNTKKNQLRYLFGSSNYEKAFKSASSHQYYLLDEAINALSA